MAYNKELPEELTLKEIFMSTNKLSFSELLTVGLMLFALFLGAGNIIFPPLLGQGPERT